MPASSATGIGQGSADRHTRGYSHILKILQNDQIHTAFELTNGKIILSENKSITSGSSIYRTSFNQASLTGSILQVTHNLANKYVEVTVYDNTDTSILPKDVIVIDSNHLNVDLDGFTPIAGTWNICVVG